MQKMHKTLVGVVAAALTFGAAFAASYPGTDIPARAAADGTNTVTATWTMGQKVYKDISAEVSDASVFTASGLNYGTTITSNRVRTAKPSSGEVKLTTYNTVQTTVADPDGYVAFTLTAAQPVTITNISLDCGAIKTGNARMDVVLESGDRTIPVASGVIPARVEEDVTKDAAIVLRNSFNVTAEALSGDIAVKFYLYGDAGKAREVGFANVVVTATGGEGGEGGGETGGDVDVPAGWMTMPGTIDIDHASWSYDGLRVEGGGANIGYAKNGTSMTGNIFVKEQGVYNLNVNFNWFSSPGDFHIEITDQATGNKEIDTYYTVTGKQLANILLEGLLTPGKKTIKYSFVADHTGFIANFTDHEATRIADKYAAITAITVDGAEAVDYEGYDYAFNIGAAYAEPTVKLSVAYSGGTVSAKMGETDLTVGADGTVAVPVPAANCTEELTVTLTPEEGAVTNRSEYKVRLYRLGDIIMTALSLDGVDVDAETVAALNNATAGVTVEGMVFTSVPVATATFIDGTTAVATAAEPAADGTVAYTLNASSGTLSKSYNFTVAGVHLFVAAETDKTAELKFDGACRGDNGIWSNGLFSVTTNDGWDGKQFKMKGNATTTLTAPTDMKIRQLTLRCLRDNYTAGRVASVTSGDATVWCPTPSNFYTGISDSEALNLVVNFEDHTPGTPIEITFEGGSQPVAWFEFIYEEVAPVTAPSLVSTSATSVADRNHAVVNFNFDREMTATTITVNGTKVNAEGGSAVLSFSLWDLPYNTDVEVTIPAGAAKDKYGNATATAATHILEVGGKAVVEPIAPGRFIEVSNVAELRAAVEGLAATNGKADAERTIIYMLNGDYDLGTTALKVCNFYNVALIGESQEGVLIHGVQNGISYPVLSTRYSTNVYMENFTLRNDLDFGKPERAGVGAAHYGGNLDIFKNVTLQSIQDTEVTGERGYWYNVTIHGSVDYICGGGDHFFEACNIQHEIAGGYIVAPSTSPSKKYGYVFSGCTIDGVGPYDLGRPWQNEPRTFYVNTTMKVLPNKTGWGKMGNLVTHFYEYNSMDADGNAIDLSTRRNSPTSVNTYTPILTDEQAAQLTVRNVLGGADSWDAAEMVAELPAPAVTRNADGTLTWNAVDGAAAYLVYADGAYVGMTTEPSYTTPMTRAADPVYTVAAINANGARGKLSEGATTGVDGIETSAGADVEYYNMQGIRVADDARGILIRITRSASGEVVSEKIAR